MEHSQRSATYDRSEFCGAGAEHPPSGGISAFPLRDHAIIMADGLACHMSRCGVVEDVDASRYGSSRGHVDHAVLHLGSVDATAGSAGKHGARRPNVLEETTKWSAGKHGARRYRNMIGAYQSRRDRQVTSPAKPLVYVPPDLSPGHLPRPQAHKSSDRCSQLLSFF